MQQFGRTNLREEAKRRRASLTQAERKKKSRQIVHRILQSQFAVNADSIALYMSIGFEVETALLAQHLLAQNKIVLAPRVLPEKKMEFARISSLDDLVPGAMNIPEPRNDLPGIGPEQFSPHLVLVPGLAFDRFGNRLGYGGGYYDRFLASCERNFPLAGVAFECQLFPFIFARPWDIPLDCVYTEKGCRFRKTAPKSGQAKNRFSGKKQPRD